MRINVVDVIFEDLWNIDGFGFLKIYDTLVFIIMALFVHTYI